MQGGNQSAQGLAPELLTTAQAAKLCGVGERTFARYASRGDAPPPVKIVGSTRYRRADLLAWIAAGCPRIDGGSSNG